MFRGETNSPGALYHIELDIVLGNLLKDSHIRVVIGECTNDGGIAVKARYLALNQNARIGRVALDTYTVAMLDRLCKMSISNDPSLHSKSRIIPRGVNGLRMMFWKERGKKVEKTTDICCIEKLGAVERR